MKNNFAVTIGIEIHLELNTKTKMFSSSPNDFHAENNTSIQPLDLGYPGTLPRVNKEAVIKAIKFGKALNMEIASTLTFDRKNYFYPDLPKGFQITQDDNPIGKNGVIKLKNKNIRIERIHLEEDTAKSFHTDKGTLLNFNRAGVPLLEIVSKPDIETSEEASEYIDTIKQLALSQDISDAKMEEGSLRADVNISIRPYGQKELGTRVEIKNMNSLNNVVQAIEFEISEQVKQITLGQGVVQSTKRFDESTKTTISMRDKSDAVDYKYMPEPNIPEIKLSNNFIDNITIDELPETKKQRYENDNISEEYISQLMSDIDKSKYFDSIKYHDRNKLSKVFFAEIVPLSNANNLKVRDLLIDPSQIDVVMEELAKGNISGKHLKIIFPELLNNASTYEEIVKSKNIALISDVNILSNFVKDSIKLNKEFILKSKDRIERVQKFIIGDVMKKTKGQANPVLLHNIVIEELKSV